MADPIVALYRSGKYADAWEALRERFHPSEQDVVASAHEVARLTMKRVRRNVETVTEHLGMIAYEFASPRKAHLDPPRDVDASIGRLEELVGPVPIAVKAFWRQVGSVDLRGEFAEESEDGLLQSDASDDDSPRFDPYANLDPLVVYPVSTAIDAAKRWRAKKDTEAGPFRIPLGPDAYHKADGAARGCPYLIDPTALLDGLVIGDSGSWDERGHALADSGPFVADRAGGERLSPFIDYLWMNFQYGGFPGLGKMLKRSPLADLRGKLKAF